MKKDKSSEIVPDISIESSNMKDSKLLPSNYIILGWNPRHLRSDMYGNAVDSKSDNITHVSLWGAVIMSWENKYITAYDCEALHKELIRLIPDNYVSIEAWDKNPYRTHDEVITMILNAEQIFAKE